MPSTERKYTKQNLKRCMGHLDDIQNYLIAIGSPFLEASEELKKEGKPARVDYDMVVEGIDICVDNLNELRKMLEVLDSVI